MMKNTRFQYLPRYMRWLIVWVAIIVPAFWLAVFYVTTKALQQVVGVCP